MGKGRYRLTRRGLVWYAHVYENGIRRQVSTRCTDLKAAELALRQLERDLANRANAAAKKASLSDALNCSSNDAPKRRRLDGEATRPLPSTDGRRGTSPGSSSTSTTANTPLPFSQA
jgi:hypothetical protein